MPGWDDDVHADDAGPADDEVSSEPELSSHERARRADEDVQRLTRYGVLLSVAAVLVAALAALFGVKGAASFAPGLAIGCAVATVNLRVLARSGWAVLSGEGAARALLGFGVSFLVLVSAAFWLVLAHRDWLIGFGVGLGLPAAVGLWYGIRLGRDPVRGD